MCSCDYCHQIPHLPGCPNAPDPEPVKTCWKCGEGILEGEEYLETEKGPLCMGCLEDMSVKDVVEICGERLSVAQ